MKPIEKRDGYMCHRPWFKVVFNPVLRLVQFWTNRPFVLVSRVEKMKVIGYALKRMKLIG